MTSARCAEYVSAMLSDNVKMRALDTTSPYTDVFTKDVATGLIDCGNGFDERYAKPRKEGGRYPTMVDMNNLFAAGINYGKLRALGMRAQWDSVFADSIGGYAQGAVVCDSSGRKFISRIDNNKNALPTDGKGNAYWNRDAATPRFIGNNINTHATGDYETLPKTTIAFIKLDVELPTEPVTTRMRIASFTGAQLSTDMDSGVFECSGIVVFSDTVCWGPISPANIKFRRRGWLGMPFLGVGADGAPIANDGSSEVASSYSLKLSPYPDLYTNEDHADAFIELLSRREVPWNDGQYPVARMGDFRSPAQAVPIRKDKTYYLYVEYDNCMMAPVDRNMNNIPSPTYLEVYPFARALEMPRTN